MVKLGIICLANDSGLGYQTRRLTYMLKPHRILVIDSTNFSKNKIQHWDWYDGFKGYRVDGFPKNHEIDVFIKDLTHVLVCENPLNFRLLDKAQQQGVKLYIQSNYEFCDHLAKPNLTLPTQFLMPSYWKVEEMKKQFGSDKVDHLPPPIDPIEFRQARAMNVERKGKKRFLHVVGTLAANDRNGTLDLLEAVKKCDADFDLVIRSQHELPPEYMMSDPRVTYSFENISNPEDMYMDFDAMILPRRYGGLCLSCDEALMSGLPVIMTGISPNNKLLPKEWLIPAYKKGSFFTRTNIDIYGSDTDALSAQLDVLSETDLTNMKLEAFKLGHDNFSPGKLKPLYNAKFNPNL